MKQFVTLIVLGLCTLAMNAQKTTIQVLSQTAEETILKIDFAPVNLSAVETQQGTAYTVQIDEGTPLLQEGAPDLPKVAIPVMIPLTGGMAIEVLEETGMAEQHIAIAPSKGNLKRNINPSEVPYLFGPVYTTNEYFPNKKADLQTPFIFRDARGQSLWAYPAQYNPSTQILLTRTSATIRIYKASPSGENEGKAQAQRSLSRAFEQVYRKLFVNYDKNRLVQTRSALEPEKMLIIVNDQLLGEMDAFVAWKRQTGVHTTVVPLSAIGNQSPGDLYTFVKNYYQANGITYLLVVADENAMPPMLRPGSTYSCDNCLGYMDGDDHFPEVLVGRFHASNVAQLRIMTRRNQLYEQTPLVDTTSNWCATAMASSSDQGQGIGDDNQADYEQSNEWKTKHLGDGYEKIWEFYDGNHGDISPTPGSETADQPGDPTNIPLVALMNGRGIGLYNYTGHGWEQGLSSGNFSTDAVAELRNDNRYPIIIGVACCAGNFTNGECLGEALQRAGNADYNRAWGSVMAYLSSDFQSWAPPMEGQDGMNQYLIDADGVDLFPIAGAMSAYGNALMIAAYGQAGVDMADVWNPFGEPTLVPRTRLPQTLTATHPVNIFLGSTSLSIYCPVEGAQIGLYYEGQALAVATVQNGVALLEFPSLNSVGNLWVTGTQFNYIPYQGSMVVVPASGPYLVNQSLAINDAAGNSNGLADYAETISADLTLANIGLEPATATVAYLSTSDPYIELLDGDENMGDIQDSTELYRPGAFSYKVAPYVPDGHIALFTLTLEYSSGQVLSYPVNQLLNAPKIVVASYSMVEGPGSDNDGKFETGETILVIVKNRNDGHSSSQEGVAELQSNFAELSVSSSVNISAMDPGVEKNALFYVTVGNFPNGTSVSLDYYVLTGDYNASHVISPVVINPIIENFESVNFESYPWEMGGNKPWVISNLAPYAGIYCSRSGLINHSQKSQMFVVLNVLEDGFVSFAKKVSSEENYDFLRFYIDDVVVGEWTGSLPWGVVSFPVTAGEHTLLWSYEKDQFGTTLPDRAYVDDISLPAHEAVVSAFAPDNTSFQSFVTPNPAAGSAWLHLQLATSDEVSYELNDCTGKRVIYTGPASFPSGTHHLRLDLEKLSAGIYFLQVRDSKGVASHRIVVE